MRCRTLSEYRGGEETRMRSDRHRLNMGQDSPGRLRLSTTFPRGLLRAQLKAAVDSTPVKLRGKKKKKIIKRKSVFPASSSSQGKLTRIILEKRRVSPLTVPSRITHSHRRAPIQPVKAGWGWLEWVGESGRLRQSN